MNKNQYVILIDFDKTISINDVGRILLEKFAKPGWKELEKKREKGEMGSKECCLRQYPFIKTRKNKILQIILKQEIDPYFKEFIKYINKKSIKLAIVSDGFDFYINKILKKYNINNIKLYSNIMKYHPDGLKLKFPYENPNCNLCACCKTMIVNKYLNNNLRVIFIGDSYGDSYAARIADVIFAKNELNKFCKENNINCIQYNDFRDILYHFKNKELIYRFNFISNRNCIKLNDWLIISHYHMVNVVKIYMSSYSDLRRKSRY